MLIEDQTPTSSTITIARKSLKRYVREKLENHVCWKVLEAVLQEQAEWVGLKNSPLLLSPSHPLVPLKPSCAAPLLNTPVGRVSTGSKTRFSHGVKPSELLCHFNLSESYLPTSICGKMFRSYLKPCQISFSLRI